MACLKFIDGSSEKERIEPNGVKIVLEKIRKKHNTYFQ